jgi:glycosyltransferase involved in cell wall biosynthesis
MIYRIELVSNHLSDLSTLDKVKLDLLIITHQGGGGVGEVVRERVQECVGLGKSVGVLKANQAGDMILSLRNFSIAINLDVDFSRLLAQALEIEIHHILGLENLLDEVSKHRIDTIYLHDKYFITQRPFADTLKYISVPRDTSGINSPLNRHSNYGDDAWLQKTRKILLNSTSLRAPSNYLIEEYRLVIPELKIEKIDIESNLVPIRRNHPFTDIGNIVLISPTGAHKGGTILAQVAKIFEYDRPSTMFRVFGDLDILTEEALKKLQNVTLHGQVSRPRLNNALVTSGPSLGWIPSLTGESYSLALSDFLSNGIAVIAANTGALRERLTEVPGNYLYDPAIPAEVLANLIIAIMEDKDLDEFLPHFQFT